MNAPSLPGFARGQRQRGAVAIMFGLSIFVLFGFMGLALDLSQTYDRKTELQNAADAAALAGAKELKGDAAGIGNAVNKAKAIAALHKFKFGTSIALADAAITFSDSPDTPDAGWLGIDVAQANPGGLYFIKIDTRDGNNGKYGEVNTYFMHVLSASAATTNTFGRGSGEICGRYRPFGNVRVDGRSG
ncbi:pilus assembly protein TadG-related protein [Polaromonas sp. P2-4]|nr:pilus assembly protein TadG-related protein [Polaromonas sp. P2-4]